MNFNSIFMISTLILNVNLSLSLFGFQTSMTQKIGQIGNSKWSNIQLCAKRIPGLLWFY